jgi:hypothetical protein
LNVDERGGATKLGWNQSSWDCGLCCAPPSDNRTWSELSSAEVEGAQAFGYTEQTWKNGGWVQPPIQYASAASIMDMTVDGGNDVTSCYYGIWTGAACKSDGGVFKISESWYVDHPGGAFSGKSCGSVVESWLTLSGSHKTAANVVQDGMARGLDLTHKGKVVAQYIGPIDCAGEGGENGSEDGEDSEGGDGEEEDEPNPFVAPEKHTAKCLLMPDCVASGYAILVQTAGATQYTLAVTLDTPGTLRAQSQITSALAAGKTDDFKVVATGTLSADGTTLLNSNIELVGFDSSLSNVKKGKGTIVAVVFIILLVFVAVGVTVFFRSSSGGGGGAGGRLSKGEQEANKATAANEFANPLAVGNASVQGEDNNYLDVATEA